MEWVDLKSGKQQVIQGMHTYASLDVSTHKIKMDLRSEGKNLMIPSLMFMRFL